MRKAQTSLVGKLCPAMNRVDLGINVPKPDGSHNLDKRCLKLTWD